MKINTLNNQILSEKDTNNGYEKELQELKDSLNEKNVECFNQLN